MYLCCRVKHKEGAGLLYARLRLYIRIENTRYVRFLFPYPSATCCSHWHWTCFNSERLEVYQFRVMYIVFICVLFLDDIWFIYLLFIDWSSKDVITLQVLKESIYSWKVFSNHVMFQSLIILWLCLYQSHKSNKRGDVQGSIIIPHKWRWQSHELKEWSEMCT